MSSNTVRKTRIFTIGHSDRTLKQFLSILELSSVSLVADVRSNPTSGRFPHFERAALSFKLEKRGLSYRWFRELGGRRPKTSGEEDHTALKEGALRRYAAAMNTNEFTQAAVNLLGLSSSTIVAIMCAERDFEYCHRSLLADKLTYMGARVVHIKNQYEAQEHCFHPDLHFEDGKLIYKQRQLDLL